MYVSSQSPYYDDFNESKQFHRILFRPGRAVQARELTQLQTILQKQIDRFGQNIFKEGSLVIPGNSALDTNYKYVKLQTTYNSIAANTVLSDLVGSVITGATSGVKAVVVNYTLSEGTDYPTLYVKYVNSGSNGSTTSFADDEVISNSDSSISVKALASSATGVGTAFTINSGVIFVKGSFVYFDTQTLILSKYDTISNILVGFDIGETVVTSDDDTSLLDPAVGSYNYFAPGADRYKIALDLATREFIPTTTDDPNFVELIRIQSGGIISQKKYTDYNILNDTLARRTFDESGNYVVNPYKINIQNHLKSSNVVNDGYLTSADGGDDNKCVSIVSPGKAYVRGYEIDNLNSTYIIGNKARDYNTVNNGTVATTFGNYVFVKNVYSVPTLTTLASVDLYDRYTTAAGTASGTKVGTARVRSMDYYSGTPGSATAVYQLFLFDVQMLTGYTFEKNVKQIYGNNDGYADFTSDISPETATITGSVSTTANSNVLVGTGTRFSTVLTAGDYITVNSGSTFRVATINSDVSVTLGSNASANLSGVLAAVHSAKVNDSDKNIYVFEMPFNTIKTVDPTGVETNYQTRRVYSRTLSGGNVSITAGTDETFSGFSLNNYQLVITSGGSAGTHVDLTGKVTRSGSPTGKTVTFTLGGGYSNEDVIITTTVAKTSSAADKKIKTLVSDATVDYTSNTDCQATTISIGKSDVYKLTSVKMSGNAFGTSYSTTNEVDITNRYTLDNGQRTTFYDVGTIKLKPNQAKPTGPIRITFDYFSHGSGDYFSVDSYGDIAYKDIPSFVVGNKTYQLRDCLDFRPRINDAGTGFSGSGSSVNEFLDFENDIITDYQYYLPRIDKLVIDDVGGIKVIEGNSSLNPQEPPTPSNSMPLYVFKQKAYVFDVKKDIDVIAVDNRRYTMRDIGRIENRVKNLEYYTTLSLLEKDTQQFQIKDGLGFDRFKNGFLVDSFKGHGVGDAFNKDYSVAVDFNKNEARPVSNSRSMKLVEIATTTGSRTSNNYAKIGDFITLPYTEEVVIQNTKASKTENLNPYNIVNFNGLITLDPPSDTWFDTVRLPDIQVNREGNYDTLVAQAQSRGTWGTVWGSWRDAYYGNGGNELVQQRSGVSYSVSESIDTSTNNDVVVSKVIVPKMRDTVIKFTARGMKPNTRLYAFFDQTNVTRFCAANVNTSGNVNLATSNIFAGLLANVVTDYTGFVEGHFSYNSTTLNFNTGEHTFRLTDSSTNGSDKETFAEAAFVSNGELQNVRNEIVSTRNATLVSTQTSDERAILINNDPPPPPPVEWPPVPNPPPVEPPIVTTGPIVDPGPPVIDVFDPVVHLDLITATYRFAFGRDPDAEGYAYWAEQASKLGITNETLRNMDINNSTAIGSDGGVDPSYLIGPNTPVGATYNSATTTVYNFVNTITQCGVNEINREYINPNGAINIHNNNGADLGTAAAYAAAQVTAVIAYTASGKTTGLDPNNVLAAEDIVNYGGVYDPSTPSWTNTYGGD